MARKITIRKNGNPISFPKEYYNGIYTRVTSSNNGDKYECEVDNRFYTRTSDTVEVNVQCKFQKRQWITLKGSLIYLGACICVAILILDVVKTDEKFAHWKFCMKFYIFQRDRKFWFCHKNASVMENNSNINSRADKRFKYHVTLS